ncbi:MAG: DNA-3-methyladenine glycosylase I, partial [Thaumarchaeota archaeon]|nr:DNA-3-methyladenine glycosylase I [Nitrososphaerota archaeon]
MVEKVRCGWVGNDPLMVKYHDEEWGSPVHDDRKLFEFLMLGGVQAGLSWSIVLKKREGYRKGFDGFDFLKIARYSKDDVERLINNPAIIRNRLKINAAVSNAQNFIAIQEEFGSFEKYIWQFVNGKTIVNKFEKLEHYPTTTKESDEMSKDLKNRGFKFVGSTICYGFMQAVGM